MCDGYSFLNCKHPVYDATSIFARRTACIAICLVSLTLLAENGAVAQRLPFGNLRVRDGLPANYISCLAQDRAGRLWVGTSDGVCRFDGLEFSYLPGRFLAGRHIMALSADPQDGMWMVNGDSLMLARDSSISVFRFRRPQTQEILTAIAHVPGRGTWTGSTRGLAVLRDGALHPVPVSFRLDGVVRMICDSAGRLWILNEKGIHTYDPATGEGRTVDSVRGRYDGVHSMMFDRHGDLHVCSRDSCILRFHAGRFAARYRFTDAQPTDLVQDEHGSWWITSSNGLFLCESSMLDPSRCVQYTRKNGLPSTRFNLAMMDPEAVLWFGSEGNGLTSLEDRSVQVFEAEDMTGKGAEDRRGRLWMSGHSGIREFWREGGRWHEKLHPRRNGWPDGYSYHVQATNDDRLWVTFSSGALAVFDIRRTSSAQADLHVLHIAMPLAGLPDPDPFCFVVDHRYRLWARTRVSDVAVLDVRGKPVPLKAFANPHPDIRAMYEDADGSIWLGGYGGGVYTYSDSSLRRSAFERLQEPVMESVRAFLRDRAGRLWIGTMNGLLVETSSGWRRFDTENGLPNNRVFALAQGPDGRVWIGTQTGIASLDENLEAVYRYPALTDSPVSACGVVEHDLLWAATAFGLTLYDRTLSHPDTTPPVVVLQGFAVNGLPLQFKGNIALPFTANNIRIGVATVRMRNAREIRYQYRFPDIDSTWSAPSASRSISFPAMRPATYLLEVRALTSELVSSRDPLRLRFSVDAPFWQRWWFYTGLVLLVAFALITMHRVHLQRLLAAERLRTQIAAYLHDDIGSGLTRIAMLSDVMMQQRRQERRDAESDGDMPHPLQATITRVGAIARELVESMSDVVWSLDPRNVTLEQLADRLRVFANDLADPSDMQVEFTVTDAARRLTLRPEVSRPLLLVVKEALSNIVRHAQASHVRVFIDSADAVVRFEVEDDGAGFDPHAILRRSGLAHMEQRLAACGGRFSVRSEPGRGTRIEGVLPLIRKN